MSLKIGFEDIKFGECISILPIGEIDIHTSPMFKDEVNRIIDKKIINIVINCSSLDYIDSTGLGALIAILKRVKEKNLNLKIINLKPNIYKLFDITGLDKIFNIEV